MSYDYNGHTLVFCTPKVFRVSFLIAFTPILHVLKNKRCTHPWPCTKFDTYRGRRNQSDFFCTPPSARHGPTVCKQQLLLSYPSCHRKWGPSHSCWRPVLYPRFPWGHQRVSHLRASVMLLASCVESMRPMRERWEGRRKTKSHEDAVGPWWKISDMWTGVGRSAAM